MRLFAIGDLHLAHTVSKPMEVFGDMWDQHTEKLKDYWEQTVTDEDVVILCGDLSWAMRLEQAEADLKFIDALPGKKICIKGNHDYWWHKVTKLNTLYEHIHFLQNTSYTIGNVTICGTRAWLCPQDESFTEEDRKIYIRENERLKLSLKGAKSHENQHVIVALHYPPTNGKKEHSLFTETLEAQGVEHVVYGHLHDELSWQACLQGERNGVNYHLVAADYLGFKPLYLTDIDIRQGKETQ